MRIVALLVMVLWAPPVDPDYQWMCVDWQTFGTAPDQSGTACATPYAGQVMWEVDMPPGSGVYMMNFRRVRSDGCESRPGYFVGGLPDGAWTPANLECAA